MFWRAMACSPPLPAKIRHSAKSLAGDGGRCRVLAANGVQSATPANVGNLWRAMAVLGGSPSSSATPAILVAANGGSEYTEY